MGHHVVTSAAITVLLSGAMQVVMDMTIDPVAELFAAWRADIDSEPFAHEPDLVRLITAAGRVLRRRVVSPPR